MLTPGIKYKDSSASDKERVESIVEENVNDDYIITKEKLFMIFYKEDTYRKVLGDLMKNGIRVDMGQVIGEIIIFAYNHKHVELIVNVFNETYRQYGDDYRRNF